MSVVFSECTFGYGRNEVLFDRFSLEFEPGLTVLLGPNGAGKTTLLSLAASVHRPRSGSVTVEGQSGHDRRTRKAYRRRVGWLPQQVLPMPGLGVREQVAYAGWLKGLSRSEAWERARLVLPLVELDALADKATSTLSGGQLRRVGIAQALVHEATVILMDEPTAGLDPRQRKGFREVLARLPEGISVVVSTHQTEDLSTTYRRVVVLDRARVRFRGSVPDFLALGGDVVGDVQRSEAAYLRLVGAEA